MYNQRSTAHDGDEVGCVIEVVFHVQGPDGGSDLLLESLDVVFIDDRGAWVFCKLSDLLDCQVDSPVDFFHAGSVVVFVADTLQISVKPLQIKVVLELQLLVLPVFGLSNVQRDLFPVKQHWWLSLPLEGVLELAVGTVGTISVAPKKHQPVPDAFALFNEETHVGQTFTSLASKDLLGAEVQLVFVSIGASQGVLEQPIQTCQGKRKNRLEELNFAGGSVVVDMAEDVVNDAVTTLAEGNLVQGPLLCLSTPLGYILQQLRSGFVELSLQLVDLSCDTPDLFNGGVGVLFLLEQSTHFREEPHALWHQLLVWLELRHLDPERGGGLVDFVLDPLKWFGDPLVLFLVQQPLQVRHVL
jgi:hypothetical protein